MNAEHEQLRLDAYGGRAPHVAGDETSEAGAASTDRASAQTRVLHAVAATWSGMTCGEVEIATGLTHQSASARLRELSQDDDAPLWIIGKRRNASTGRDQRVYMAADVARRRGVARVVPEAPTRRYEPANLVIGRVFAAWNDGEVVANASDHAWCVELDRAARWRP